VKASAKRPRGSSQVKAEAGCYKIMLASGHRSRAHAFYAALGFDAQAKQSFVLSR
jgi:hypothetical protein